MKEPTVATTDKLLQTFPTRKIKATDGMLVTAATWNEEHDYHRQYQRFNTLLNHGPGILAGFEVIASNPPDRSVYISPGIAVDPLGQIIVLPKATTYDLGQTAEGLLYLWLSYQESHPRPDPDKSPDYTDGPLYAQTGVTIASRSTWPDTPGVELARIWRESRTSPAFDAKDAAHPGLNEIDLRFRRVVGLAPRPLARLAVRYLGSEGVDAAHLQGVDLLARNCRQAANLHVVVEANAPLGANLETFTLVYLVGLGAFRLSGDEISALRAYLQQGGTLLLESRRAGNQADAPADASFRELLAALNVSPAALPTDHPLLLDPFPFGSPPPGFETHGAATVTAAGGVIFSTCDYGGLWQRQRRSGPASREEIRAALEWGANIISYAAAHKA